MWQWHSDTMEPGVAYREQRSCWKVTGPDVYQGKTDQQEGHSMILQCCLYANPSMVFYCSDTTSSFHHSHQQPDVTAHRKNKDFFKGFSENEKPLMFYWEKKTAPQKNFISSYFWGIPISPDWSRNLCMFAVFWDIQDYHLFNSYPTMLLQRGHPQCGHRWHVGICY